jgi:gliding motility-associated lipoprotein GldK
MVKNLKIARFRFLLMLLVLTMSTLLFFAFESNQLSRNARVRTDAQMTYVQGGAFYMGASDEQVDNTIMNQKKLVSVAGFWMDRTEITNEQYHKFVNYVSDSLKYLNYYLKTTIIPDEDTLKVDWKKVAAMNKIISTAKTPKAIEGLLSSKMNELVLSQENRMKGHPLQIDPRKLIYRYYFVDLKKAADTTASRKGLEIDKQIFKVTKIDSVYPDTLVWGRDFSMSQNDPLMVMYFSHKAYYQYPVVGITWKQATAFCHWRTEHSDYYQNKPGNKDYIIDGIYRLPSEAEWEYAARGNAKINGMFPWGAPYARTREGRLMANFKPGRGDYFGGDTRYDGITPVKVKSYTENGFGLFDMAGNVAEWTSTVYEESGGPADFNPNYQFDVDATTEITDPRAKKSIRGGSWKDIAYNCQVSTRNYEYQFNAKSYIGFRCVMSAPPKY